MTFSKHNWNELSESSQRELKLREAYQEGYRQGLLEAPRKAPRTHINRIRPDAGGLGAGDALGNLLFKYKNRPGQLPNRGLTAAEPKWRAPGTK